MLKCRFHDTSWQPVDCEHADRIEAEHIKRFMGHKMADYVRIKIQSFKDCPSSHDFIPDLGPDQAVPERSDGEFGDVWISRDLVLTSCQFYFRFNTQFSWRL